MVSIFYFNSLYGYLSFLPESNGTVSPENFPVMGKFAVVFKRRGYTFRGDNASRIDLASF